MSFGLGYWKKFGINTLMWWHLVLIVWEKLLGERGGKQQESVLERSKPTKRVDSERYHINIKSMLRLRRSPITVSSGVMNDVVGFRFCCYIRDPSFPRSYI
jgi:hypothetical protein